MKTEIESEQTKIQLEIPESYELSENEAIQLYLEDEDLLENAELEELDSKAKKVKINHGASAVDKTEKKEKILIHLT